MEFLSQCWFLAGPTACGKTAAALHLADRINGEIVALDSMTVYRGLDIGTAKPTADEQARVRHHMIDILDPQEEYSLAEYLDAAESACKDIFSRGRVPLFVGGTGLYLRGLLRGVFEGPSADWNIRRRLEEVARTDGSRMLHDQLRGVDPVTADRLHPNDERRIIRAIEVFELTGQPLSSLQQNGPRPISERPSRVFWLSPPRDWLHHRIDVRVEQMFAAGLVNEVKRLIDRHLPISHTARQALGYKEVIDWLESTSLPGTNLQNDTQTPSETVTQADLVTLIQTRTRQFAKRQHTWFRNLEECRPIPILGTETAYEVVSMVIQAAHDA